MLRIPITFDLTPIERLQSADDLYKITLLDQQPEHTMKQSATNLPAAPECAPSLEIDELPLPYVESTRMASSRAPTAPLLLCIIPSRESSLAKADGT